jgi:hypothetical protein
MLHATHSTVRPSTKRSTPVTKRDDLRGGADIPRDNDRGDGRTRRWFLTNLPLATCLASLRTLRTLILILLLR